MRRALILAASLLIAGPVLAQTKEQKDDFNIGVIVQAFEDCNDVVFSRSKYLKLYQIADMSVERNAYFFNEGKSWAAKHLGHKDSCELAKVARRNLP